MCVKETKPDKIRMKYVVAKDMWTMENGVILWSGVLWNVNLMCVYMTRPEEDEKDECTKNGMNEKRKQKLSEKEMNEFEMCVNLQPIHSFPFYACNMRRLFSLSYIFVLNFSTNSYSVLFSLLPSHM